jgi:hypothetical protein
VILGRFQRGESLTKIAKRTGRERKEIQEAQRKAFLRLRREKRVEEIKEVYGYERAYKGSFSNFRDTGTSTTELLAVNRADAELQAEREAYFDNLVYEFRQSRASAIKEATPISL